MAFPMYKYSYNGPVMRFEQCIERFWKAETYAPSAEKALNNLAYRYKKTHGLQPSAKIELPGKLTIS